jgi:hypothetical protein
MKRFYFLRFLFLFSLLAFFIHPVEAQGYIYEVTRYEANFFANADGTASVEYYIDFTNSSSGPTMEFIDIGLPNKNFDLSSVSADINGIPVNVVNGDPAYIPIGVTAELGAHSIAAGQSAKFHLFVPVQRDMFYVSRLTDTSEDYASFNFSPNDFGSGVQGNTEYIVTLFLPPGLKSEEPRYHTPQSWPGADAPQSGYTADDRVFYSWTSTDARADGEYIVGASFPSRLLPANVIQSEPKTSLTFNQDTFFGLCCGGGFLGFIGLIIYSSIWGEKKRKLKYLPPKIAIEGYGIKRGLTAVEAAILMEQPLDKVLTMLLFGALKKGAAEVKSKDPLELTIPDVLPEGLHEYEVGFLNAFKIKENAPRRKALQEMVVKLVKSIQEKMKGFNRKETIAFYEEINRRAWQQVEEAKTPEVQSQVLDEGLDWMMLDRQYEKRSKDVFTQPVYAPTWWWRYDPTFRPSTTTTTSSGGGGLAAPISSSRPSVSMPTLPGADFAASVVTGVQSFSSKVIGNVTDFTNGVTRVTNPVPVSTTSSGYRGGGGSSGGRSCACACACAGCACACAGGGR